MNDQPQTPGTTNSALPTNAELLHSIQFLESEVVQMKDEIKTLRKKQKQRPEAPKALEIAPEIADELLSITRARMNGEKVDKNHPLLVDLREMAQYNHTRAFHHSSSKANTMNRLKRLEELEKARKLFLESEWRLNFLRTQTGTSTPEPTDQEILQWYQNIQQRTHFRIN